MKLARHLDPIRRIRKALAFELRALLYSIAGRIKVMLNRKRYCGASVEIGAGKTRKPGFISNDMSLSADVPFDLRQGLPFPPGSLRMIYCEHVLEHFDYPDMLRLVNGCHEALDEGGVLDCVVPDAALFVKAYNEADFGVFGAEISELKRLRGYSYASRCDILNHIFYMSGHHRYMFDRDSLRLVLLDVGFGEVVERPFDPSLDQEVRRRESIYFRAVKR